MLAAEECYGAGLDRVARVIEGALDYDSFLDPERLAKIEYQKIIDTHASGKVDGAASLFAAMVRKVWLAQYKIPESIRIISFAKTRNNRIQLDFIDKKTRAWRTTDIFELSGCALDRKSKVNAHFSKAMEAKVCRFFLGRKSLSRSLLHQAIGYSAAYCSMLESLRARPRIKGLIVANDHSPVPVAVGMACKALGIKRVYLQHAQVTTIFPPLDFEYSVLMDRRSEQVYRNIERTVGGVVPAGGEVVVLQRKVHEIHVGSVLGRMEELSSNQNATVALYPSAIFNASRLRALISALKNNPSIGRIFLKPHPSTDIVELANSAGIEVRAKVPEQPHIAIVGNSSVALELAVAGNLVFQDFALDTIAKDYYGFARDGLTGEVDLERAAQWFWHGRGTDASVVNAVKDRLDEAEHCLGAKEEEQFLKKMTVDLGGGWQPKMTSAEELQLNLQMFPRSFFSLARSETEARYTELGDLSMIGQLDALFNERKIKLNALYQHVDPARCRSVVDFWFISKLVEWSGAEMDERCILACWKFVNNYAQSIKVKRWLETKFFDLLLRTGRLDVLERFLSSTEHFRVESAHLNKKIAFTNACNRPGAEEFGLGRFYNYREDALGEFERLKLMVQCMIPVQGGLAYDNYSAVEDAFLRYAPPSIAVEYRELVSTVYSRIKGKDKFIDVKRISIQAESLVHMVSDRLRRGRSFSIIRLSDGEGYLFQHANSFFTDADARNRERHWWGMEIDSELREAVISSGLDTIANADVIGIPSIYRFLRDHSPKSRSLLASLQGRGLMAVLQGVLQYAPPGADFGDDKLNIAVFNQRRNLEKIASAAKNIIVVTGAKSSIVREALAYLGNLHVINIPTHNKTTSNDRFWSADRPLPFVFSEIRDRIQADSAPGTLVLVGAGIAGKSFVQAAKLSGGVGLDLGSALDELVDAGIHSLH